jgi:hypothetical protein
MAIRFLPSVAQHSRRSGTAQDGGKIAAWRPGMGKNDLFLAV